MSKMISIPKEILPPDEVPLMVISLPNKIVPSGNHTAEEDGNDDEDDDSSCDFTYEWQKEGSSHMVCNSVHEFDLRQQSIMDQFTIIAQGANRLAIRTPDYSASTNKRPIILKVALLDAFLVGGVKCDRRYMEGNRVDSMIMEHLTSSP
jgi:hypothetical protein